MNKITNRRIGNRLRWFSNSFLNNKKELKPAILIDGNLFINVLDNPKLAFIWLDILEQKTRESYYADPKNDASFDVMDITHKRRFQVYKFSENRYYMRHSSSWYHNGFEETQFDNIWEISKETFEEIRCILHLFKHKQSLGYKFCDLLC